MSHREIKRSKLENEIIDGGFRLTGARKTIFNIISAEKMELSAEEIFILARKKDQKIGIATIYRTLRLLEGLEAIKKVYSADRKPKYIFVNKPLIPDKGIVSDHRPDAADMGLDKIRYKDFADIDKVQIQLDKWILELNKIKQEKEIKLEDMINGLTGIDKVLDRYENDKSNLIQILLDVQGNYNWLPKHATLYLGNKLGIPLTQIYAIASFYKFFNLEPKGKYQITVCAGTACHVRGSMNLLQRIVNILKINPGDTTADYKFTLDTVNCLGCCALGPVMYFNNKYYSNPTAKELKRLFNAV